MKKTTWNSWNIEKHIPFFRGYTGLIIHADNAMFGSLSNLLKEHASRPSGCIGTMVTFNTTNPKMCGVVKVDEMGRMREFYEKVENPPTTIANGAVYAIEEEFLNYTLKKGEEIKDLSRDLIQNMGSLMYTWMTDQPFVDIGTPESLALAQLIWNNGRRMREGYDF